MKMRIPLIAGNWKMNMNIPEAIHLARQLKLALKDIAGVEKAVCPSFTALYAVYNILKNSSINVGAQNIYYEKKGAFTGEISAPMLSEICRYVIVGHSERRQYFHETNEIVNKKTKAALDAGLKPILCVGENLLEYETGKTTEVVAEQLIFCLQDISFNEQLVIAYEPIWAIGTGKFATGIQAESVIWLIRNTLTSLSNQSISQLVRIIYGGSVNAENINEFISQPDIDGVLVGGASLEVDQFVSIVRRAAIIKSSH